MVKSILMSFLLVLALCMAANANMLANGSFENPADPLPAVDQHLKIWPGAGGAGSWFGDSIPGWTGIGSSWNPWNEVYIRQPDFGQVAYPVPDGVQACEIGAGHGIWSDTVPMEVGNDYTLTFAHLGDGLPVSAPDTDCSINMLFMDDNDNYFSIPSVTNVVEDQWNYATIEFTMPATGMIWNGSEHVEGPLASGNYHFRMMNWYEVYANFDYHGDVWVDDLVLTPEPATMLLLGLGGLAAIRRKR